MAAKPDFIREFLCTNESHLHDVITANTCGTTKENKRNISNIILPTFYDGERRLRIGATIDRIRSRSNYLLLSATEDRGRWNRKRDASGIR